MCSLVLAPGVVAHSSQNTLGLELEGFKSADTLSLVVVNTGFQESVVVFRRVDALLNSEHTSVRVRSDARGLDSSSFSVNHNLFPGVQEGVRVLVSSVHYHLVLVKLLYRVERGKHISSLPRPLLEDSSTDLGEGLSESVLELHAGKLSIFDFSGRPSAVQRSFAVNHLHDAAIACHI